jgi:hypothetical protein
MLYPQVTELVRAGDVLRVAPGELVRIAPGEPQRLAGPHRRAGLALRVVPQLPTGHHQRRAVA